jgi:hypothetical protein
LPPLSSPRRGPPQSRSGREAVTDCDMHTSGGGYRGPVTPGGGYRPWFTPEYLKEVIAIGQQSTDLIIARREVSTGLQLPAPCQRRRASPVVRRHRGSTVRRPGLRGSEVPHQPRSACLPAGYRLAPRAHVCPQAPVLQARSAGGPVKGQCARPSPGILDRSHRQRRQMGRVHRSELPIPSHPSARTAGRWLPRDSTGGLYARAEAEQQPQRRNFRFDSVVCPLCLLALCSLVYPPHLFHTDFQLHTFVRGETRGGATILVRFATNMCHQMARQNVAKSDHATLPGRMTWGHGAGTRRARQAAAAGGLTGDSPTSRRRATHAGRLYPRRHGVTRTDGASRSRPRRLWGSLRDPGVVR